MTKEEKLKIKKLVKFWRSSADQHNKLSKSKRISKGFQSVIENVARTYLHCANELEKIHVKT